MAAKHLRTITTAALVLILITAGCVNLGTEDDTDDTIDSESTDDSEDSESTDDTMTTDIDWLEVFLERAHIQHLPASSALTNERCSTPTEGSKVPAPVSVQQLRDNPEAFVGPPYRPALLVGQINEAKVKYSIPESSTPDLLLAEDAGIEVLLQRVVDFSEFSLTVNLDGPVELALDSDFSGIEKLQAAGFWWILAASAEAHLDPVNLALDAPGLGLEPVLVMPYSGGHQYGPSSPAQETGDIQPQAGEAVSGMAKVAILDTSFDTLPIDREEKSTVGHGSFIRGQILSIHPSAEITTIEVGKAGQDLAIALTASLQQVFDDLELEPKQESSADNTAVDSDEEPLGIDEMHLAAMFVYLDQSKTMWTAVNMSFGAHRCIDADEAPAGTMAAFNMLLTDGVEGVATASDGERTEFFAAAGNNSRGDKFWPAALDRVIGIGALDGERLAEFSNHGSWVNGCEQGVEVAAKAITEDGSDETFLWSGTSFAAPIALTKYLESGNVDLLPCPIGPDSGE